MNSAAIVLKANSGDHEVAHSTSSPPVRHHTYTDPLMLRGCPLTFLRCLDTFVRHARKYSGQLQLVLEEIYIMSRGTRTDNLLLCQRITKHNAGWFYNEVFPEGESAFDSVYPQSGTLESLLPYPIAQTESTRLYSAVVHGLGRSLWDEWAMGRLEWLCLQAIVKVYYMVQQAPQHTLEQLATSVQCSVNDLNFDTCWSTHKIEHDDFATPSWSKRSSGLLSGRRSARW